MFQEIWGWRLIKLAGFNFQILLFVSESGVNHCYSSIYCSRIHFFIYFYMYELIPGNPLFKKDMVFFLYVYDCTLCLNIIIVHVHFLKIFRWIKVHDLVCTSFTEIQTFYRKSLHLWTWGMKFMVLKWYWFIKCLFTNRLAKLNQVLLNT